MLEFLVLGFSIGMTVFTILFFAILGYPPDTDIGYVLSLLSFLIPTIILIFLAIRLRASNNRKYEDYLGKGRSKILRNSIYAITISISILIGLFYVYLAIL